jgi:hypothetical protein
VSAFLDEHHLVNGQIVGEQANDDAVMVVVDNHGFLDEKWVLYESMRSACDIRRE